jgi:hypothetical protein
VAELGNASSQTTLIKSLWQKWMGVRKLWDFVAQLNVGAKLSFHSRIDNTSADSFDLAHLVIDGPSFAYWFWSQCSVKQGLFL